MYQLNANEVLILKACMDNAQDAAGGDFGFSDEIHGYVSDDFSQNQVAGYLSQLQEKGLIYLDHCKTDTFDGNQITFPRFAFYVAMKAGALTEQAAMQFEQYQDYYDMNGNPDDYEVETVNIPKPIAFGQARDLWESGNCGVVVREDLGLAKNSTAFRWFFEAVSKFNGDEFVPPVKIVHKMIEVKAAELASK